MLNHCVVDIEVSSSSATADIAISSMVAGNSVLVWIVSGDNSAGSGSNPFNARDLKLDCRLIGLMPTSGDDELPFSGGPIGTIGSRVLRIAVALIAVEGRW